MTAFTPANPPLAASCAEVKIPGPLPSRITFINLYFYPDESATSYLITDLAQDLAQAGCVVNVITGRKLFKQSHETLPRLERVGGVTVTRIWTTGFGRGSLLGLAIDYLSFYLSALLTLWRVTRRDDIVIANTDPPLISVLTTWVAERKKAKAVNWHFDIFPETGRALRLRPFSWPLFHLLRYLRNRSVVSATANVTIGARMANFIRRQGARPNTVKIIHNWSDASAIRHIPAAENPLRSRLGLQDKFIVCYTGNMGRGHEFDTLLEAAQLLRDTKDIAFVFIGGGNRRAHIESEVKRRQLGNFHFVPHLARAENSVSHSLGDIYLVSLQPEMEGYSVPSKFYSVACAGKPVLFVGDPQGEIGEIVTREAIGFSIRKHDAAGLAEKIMLLAKDTELRRAMGIRARTVFSHCFDRPIALARWRQLLAEINSPNHHPC